jgi:hypothetical protein
MEVTKDYVYLPQSIHELEQNDVGFIVENLPNEMLEVEFLRTQTRHIISRNSCISFSIYETGDRYTKKVCDRCNKLLDTETQFENNRLKKGDVMTKRPSCRNCRRAKDGVGITAAQRVQWERTRPVNGSIFKCPICKKEVIVGLTKIVLDHNHSTGEVRGWICESCNTGIGRFDDHPDILRNAIAWLEDRD